MANRLNLLTPRKNWWRMGRNVLLVMVLLFGLVPNLYLSYHFICGDCLPFVAQFNHVAHFVLLAGIVGGVVVILLRGNWRQIAWFAPSLLLFGVWFGGNWLPKSTPDVEGIEIVVATYNVYGNVSDPEAVVRTIRALDADIIGLEELRGEARQRVVTDLAEKYPYQISDEVQIGTGLGLLSRYRIIESEIHITPYDPNDQQPPPSYIRAVLEIEQQNVVVYVFHAAFPKNRIFTVYNDSANLYQHRVIAGMAARESDPVILLCDCNATRRSRQYALLSQVFENSFDEGGWGFGLTFPADFPLIRIDHVWISPHFTTMDIKIWENGGTSDHRPLLATLDLRE